MTNDLKTRFDQQFNLIDRQITGWMAQNGLSLMRVSLGVVFLWFGALKLLPGLSPAEELVRNTTFFVNPDWFIPLLAVWEMAIGLGLIFGKAMRLTLALLLFMPLKHPGRLFLIMQPHASILALEYEPSRAR